MLEISTSVMQAFEKKSEDDFIANLGHFLANRTGKIVSEHLTRVFVNLGRAHGFETEKELATYAIVVVLFGKGDGEEPNWVADCLKLAIPSEKIAALRREAETMASAMAVGSRQ
jgi:hypothetical protein